MPTSLSSEVNNDRTSSQDFDLRRFLSTEHEQLLWYSQGLSSDQLSGENAVTIVHVSQQFKWSYTYFTMQLL